MLRNETAAKPERLTRALEGLRKYQEAPRDPPPPPMPVIAERFGAAIRDYGGSGPPVLFIPSLINPPNVLDISEAKSLLRWLAEQGHRPLLLDWGWHLDERKRLSVAGHVEQIILPLIDDLGEPPALVGYCLGGTMAAAAAALRPVPALATIAAPWHFSGFPDPALKRMAKLWQHAEVTSKTLGVMPMEALQSAFWSLDPARTVGKFEAYATMEPGSLQERAFVTLEDWANDGPPITAAAAREMFVSFFEQDLPGTGGWTVGGHTIAPESLSCPLLNVVSTTDRIVPAESAIRSGDRIDLAQGHVGMIVGSRGRAALWQPLSAWLSRNGAS